MCSWSIQSIRFVFFYKWIINIFLKYECVYLFVWLSSLFTLSIRQKVHRALRSKWCSTVVLLSTFQMVSMENEKKWRHTFEKKEKKMIHWMRPNQLEAICVDVSHNKNLIWKQNVCDCFQRLRYLIHWICSDPEMFAVTNRFAVLQLILKNCDYWIEFQFGSSWPSPLCPYR